jgi:hypothetical protein
MITATSQNRLERVFSDAFHWLKKSRKHYPDSSDIWDFRRGWNIQKEGTIRLFLHGSYQFDVQKKIHISNGETIALWTSPDALILKVLTCLIQNMLKPVLSRNCYHLKGHGGLKGAVRKVLELYPNYRFFCKTDVKFYYDSIDHHILLIKLHSYIRDRKIISYVWQFLNRCIEWGGIYREVKRGIARGSSLSPLLGAFYLIDLDKRLEKMDIKYFRYMDDILILAPTRWKLKKAIRVLNQTFNELKLEKHPDKTVIGGIERGFDFLGYHFSSNGLGIAKKTLENFLARAIRLYEQEPSEGFSSARLGLYAKKWAIWAYGI